MMIVRQKTSVDSLSITKMTKMNNKLIKYRELTHINSRDKRGVTKSMLRVVQQHTIHRIISISKTLSQLNQMSMRYLIVMETKGQRHILAPKAQIKNPITTEMRAIVKKLQRTKRANTRVTIKRTQQERSLTRSIITIQKMKKNLVKMIATDIANPSKESISTVQKERRALKIIIKSLLQAILAVIAVLQTALGAHLHLPHLQTVVIAAEVTLLMIAKIIILRRDAHQRRPNP
jgi:hypothetical protein